MGANTLNSFIKSQESNRRAVIGQKVSQEPVPLGQVGYDNPRDNIDPQVNTNYLKSIKIYGNDLVLSNEAGAESNPQPSLAGRGITLLRSGAANPVELDFYAASTSPSFRGGLRGVLHGGTILNPTATISTTAYFISLAGHDGTSYQASKALIGLHATNTWSPTSTPAKITFETTPTSSTTRITTMTLSGSKVGIGNPNPSQVLEVHDTASTCDISSTSHANSATVGGFFRGRHARNASVGSEQTVVTGDRLGGFLAQGYDGSSYITSSSIEFLTEGTVASTRVPGLMKFYTGTDAAPTVKTERMSINSAGLVTITGDLTLSAGNFDAPVGTVQASDLVSTGNLQVVGIVNDTGLAHGTYTATFTNVANLDSTPSSTTAQYLRLGNTVTVSGVVVINPTAAAVTRCGISLPVASNFANASECAGTAFSPGIAGQGAAILGDTTNDRAQMEWIAVDLTSQSMYFHFTYQVI